MRCLYVVCMTINETKGRRRRVWVCAHVLPQKVFFPTCVLARLQPCQTTSHPHSAQQLLDELPLGGSEKLVDLQEKRSTVLQLPLGL